MNAVGFDLNEAQRTGQKKEKEEVESMRWS